jgi:hypothetical protein
MTVNNKAQGRTLERVGTYLPNPVFSHGQLYVAASRVGERSACSFLVKAKPVQQQGVVVHEFVATRYTANVVYQVEVLLNAI